MLQVMKFPEPFTGIWVRRPEKFSDQEYWAYCKANPELRVGLRFNPQFKNLLFSPTRASF